MQCRAPSVCRSDTKPDDTPAQPAFMFAMHTLATTSPRASSGRENKMEIVHCHGLSHCIALAPKLAMLSFRVHQDTTTNPFPNAPDIHDTTIRNQKSPPGNGPRTLVSYAVDCWAAPLLLADRRVRLHFRDLRTYAMDSGRQSQWLPLTPVSNRVDPRYLQTTHSLPYNCNRQRIQHAPNLIVPLLCVMLREISDYLAYFRMSGSRRIQFHRVVGGLVRGLDGAIPNPHTHSSHLSPNIAISSIYLCMGVR